MCVISQPAGYYHAWGTSAQAQLAKTLATVAAVVTGLLSSSPESTLPAGLSCQLPPQCTGQRWLVSQGHWQEGSAACI